jgi:hypothetical protein
VAYRIEPLRNAERDLGGSGVQAASAICCTMRGRRDLGARKASNDALLARGTSRAQCGMVVGVHEDTVGLLAWIALCVGYAWSTRRLTRMGRKRAKGSTRRRAKIVVLRPVAPVPSTDESRLTRARDKASG